MHSFVSSRKEINQYLAWVMVAIAALFYSYEFILRVAPSTMFDDFIVFYHITATDVNNVVIFYALAYTFIKLIVVLLFDKYVVKKLLFFAVLCCIVGSYFLSTMSYIWVCRAGLFLMGLGSSFAFVGVLKIAAATVNRKYLGLASGITTALGMVGAICDQSIAAYINLRFDWRYTWWLYAISGLTIAFLISVFIKERTQIPEEIDLPNVQSLFKQLILLAQNRVVLLCGLIGGILYMPISVFGSVWGIPYLTSLSKNISTVQASNTVAMIFTGMMVGCPLAGILSRYITSEKLLIGSSICVLILNTALIFITSNFLLIIGMILFLIGLIGGAEVLTFTIAIENSPRYLAASAVAFVNFIVMIISGIMQYVVGLTLDYFWDGAIINGIPIYSASAYRIAIATIPVLSALGTLIFISGIIQTKSNKNLTAITLDKIKH